MFYSANYCLLVTQHNQLTEMWIVKLPLGEVNILLKYFNRRVKLLCGLKSI